MERFFLPPKRRFAAASLLVLYALVLAGCAHRTGRDSKQVVAVAPSRGGLYEVRFDVSRLKDKTRLAAVSVPIGVGQKVTFRPKRTVPTEDTPAITAFAAALSMTRNPGELQLVTRVDLREASRNKKGKLKLSKRNEGALLPLRPGDTELASVPTDPVQINVRLERR